MHWTLNRILIPAVIVAAAGGGAFTLANSAETAEKEAPTVEAPLVDIVTVKATTRAARIVGTGTVEADRKVALSAEVTGRLTKVSDGLVVGGRVKEGDFLARIDAKAYALSVRERQSQVEQARAELELERGRGKVAAHEWKVLSKDTPNRKRSSLALREPQLKAAEVGVESAKAALDRAKYDQSRTTLRAPFNATIVDESAERGGFVSPGAAIATLVGTDAFRVRVSLPIEDLALISIPGATQTEGSKAKLVQDLGPRRIEREGVVTRLVGELDADSRTAQVLVEVKDPLDPPAGELPLLPGAFVSVELDGQRTQEVVGVPLEAAYEGNRVWVITEDNTVHSRTLEVVWTDANMLFAASGVEDGDRLMVTDLPIVVDGMAVRINDEAADEQ